MTTMVSVLLIALGMGLLLFIWFSPKEVIADITPPPQLELVGVNPLPIYRGLLEGQATSAAEVAEAMATFGATLSAQSIYVMDVPSAAVLFTKQPEQVRSPASTTKLLTALVALDVYAPNQVLTVQLEGETEGTVMGLETGENIKVLDLLAGLLIQSGNDAAMVLANNHPQGYQGFVAAMNYKASQLGLESSAFTNPAGLDGNTHYSTARDLALISREVMKNPVLLPLVKTKEMLVSDTTLSVTHRLFNTNVLLGSEPGVIGIKTGTTELAGEVLITQLQRQGQEILVVMMGSQDRYADTKQVYDWIFNHYHWHQLESGTLR